MQSQKGRTLSDQLNAANQWNIKNSKACSQLFNILPQDFAGPVAMP